MKNRTAYTFLVLTIVYAGGILWCSLQPDYSRILPPGDGMEAFENFLHIPAYAGLAALMMVTLRCFRPDAAWKRSAWVWLFVIAVLYGVLNEFVQAGVPGRFCSVADMLRNALGAGIGVWVISRRRRLLRSVFYRIFIRVKPLLNKIFMQQAEFFFKVGYWPKLSRPRSFNEKLLYRKIYKPHPLSSTVADKWAVREYVRQKVSGDILNEVFWIGIKASDIPFDQLPDKFVIKATHGSSWIIIVNNKQKINREAIIEKCAGWLKSKYSERWHETHYDDIAPRIIIEKFLHDVRYGIPLDYKFLCFAGRVEFVQVDIDRFDLHGRNFYDRRWNPMDFRIKYPSGDAVMKPHLFQSMVTIAEKISADFDFCRVDLYCPEDKYIIFGEITLIPGSGLVPIVPREWDFKLGELWK